MANDYYKSKARREDEVAIYTFARVEQLIADSARSHKILEDELAGRVAELLLSQTRGQILGAEDTVPTMRRAASRNGQSLEPVEVAERAHRPAHGIERRPAQRRELEAVELFQKGMSEDEIAKRMGGLDVQTVRTYIARARNSGIDVRREKKGLRGFSYAGKHWTQQKKNKKRLKEQMRRTRAGKQTQYAKALTPAQQEAVNIEKQYPGLTHRELGEKLGGITAAAVSLRLMHAKEKLETKGGE